MSFRYPFVFLIFFGTHSLTGQVDERKTLEALRIEEEPKLDGQLQEDFWKNAGTAKNFLMVEPGDGEDIPEEYATEVKIAYNDEAIFIGAHMRSPGNEKTITQFTQRDNIGLSEYFMVDLNTYDDGENQTRFIVTTAGTIIDGKANGDNEDYTFNAVWDAKIQHDGSGWYAEIKIPYSAIRFPKREIQQWGVQFRRYIPFRNEIYSWNYINKSIGKTSQYTGILKGIRNIDPPLRLSLYPYTSIGMEGWEGQWETNFNAGMDIKYGINDAFTLDATLVPDFGHVAFDDVELNLTPFEQQFGENRAFFTEGTELFSKGDLFYSRRVGNSPTGFLVASQAPGKNEIIRENPDRTDLLNAFKISGRTDRNLGIGFFNAVTQEMRAEFQDTLTGKTRYQTTEPVTNYNIMVLDQQFNQNSSISLINTNVTREGHFRDANVTGFLFDVFNKPNSYNFLGEAKVSQINLPERNIGGMATRFSVERTKGKFRYGFGHEFANETFDINDLGINFTNNYNNFNWTTSYRIFEPTNFFNTYNIELYGNHQRRYKPDVPVQTGIGSSFFGMTRKRFAFGGFLDLNSKFHDYFEPRIEGRYVNYNPNVMGDIWVSSDYRKIFAYDARLGFAEYFESSQKRFNLEISPRVRFSNRLTVIYSFNYILDQKRQSFVNFIEGDIVFGNRDMKSIENKVQARYILNTRQGINLSFRNFWSTAHFHQDQFSILLQNGELSPLSEKNFALNPNTNFNIWNLDLSYSWQFAPGSEAILLYRNSMFNQDDLSQLNYFYSLKNLWQKPLKQLLSLRIVYYIDYSNLKNFFRG